MTNTILSYHKMTPSKAKITNKLTFMEKSNESRDNGHQSTGMGFGDARAAHADVPSVLNNILPIIAPIPRSESVTKVLMVFVKNSGIVVAVAMKVAAATSYKSKQVSDQFWHHYLILVTVIKRI